MSKLTTAFGAPVPHNQNTQTAGPRGPALLQDVWLLGKLAHFDREVVPERCMHAKGSGAFGRFTVTHDVTRDRRAKKFSDIDKSSVCGICENVLFSNALTRSSGMPMLTVLVGSFTAKPCSPATGVIRLDRPSDFWKTAVEQRRFLHMDTSEPQFAKSSARA